MSKKRFDRNDYDLEEIMRFFDAKRNVTESAKTYCSKYGIKYTDTIRKRFSEIINERKEDIGVTNRPPKILVYDIETSRAVFKRFWTGKQYVGYRDMIKEPAIISISWKWIGEDKVHSVTWDKNHCDKKLLKKFIPEFNSADLIVGVNNDNFDNRWVVARAMKHNLDINMYIKSFDVQKETKRIARVVSYSMDYITKFINTSFKQSHEGIKMWDMIEDGTPEQQKEYLKKMVTYNIGDIIATESWYLRNRKYMGHKIHAGVMMGKQKFSCPNCGGTNIELIKSPVTPAGTVQRIMRCKDDGVQFKINDRTYYNWMVWKEQNESRLIENL